MGKIAKNRKCRTNQVTIPQLPREVHDMILPYLDGQTTIHYCHAIRALNSISTTLYITGTLLSLDPDSLWPVITINQNSPISVFTGKKAAITDFVALQNRYGLLTEIVGLPEKQMIQVASRMGNDLSILPVGESLDVLWKLTDKVQRKRINTIALVNHDAQDMAKAQKA
ncbi:UNVERIFIED_CONTAM: hypothetical protein HDU68_002823, partial [Siphonaria sp. JEL0065]